MAEFLAVMAWPAALCAALALILTLLGERVLERRSVFMDLALAQVAGLGAVWGVMLGWSMDGSPWVIRAFAAGFAVVVAAAFTGLEGRDGLITREAAGGGLYALAAGATLLISTTLHHGAEEVRDLLSGKLLFVRPLNVLGALALFVPVGLFVHRFGERMAAKTVRDKKGIRAERVEPAQAWRFAFFAAVGVTVSYAVPLVGVLLVFAFLLLPAATGALLSRGQAVLRFGWIAALTGSLLGLWWAYAGDLPPEPAVTVVLGLQFLGALIQRHFASGRDRVGGLVSILASVALVAMLLAWTFQLRAREETFDPAVAEAPSGAQAALIDRLERDPDLWATERAAVLGMLAGNDPDARSRLLALIAERADTSYLDQTHVLLSDEDDFVRDAALQCLRALAQPDSVPVLQAAAETEPDPYLRADLGAALLELGSAAGTAILLDVMANAEEEFARASAFDHLREHHPMVGTEEYDSTADQERRGAAVAELQELL